MEKVDQLDFADEIVELEESLEKAQSQLDLLGVTAKEVGLHTNTTKTKLIARNIPLPPPPRQSSARWRGYRER